MKKNKMRADQLLQEKMNIESRSKAQALIMAGKAQYLDLDSKTWKKINKAGDSLSIETEFKVEQDFDVGRGAKKLRKAFEVWSFLEKSLQESETAECLDIGSSTGGFTQVLLEKKAKKVFALDVGTHQLHEKLRSDSRVVSLEKQHVLRLDENFWANVGSRGSFDMIVTDLSFISVHKVVPLVRDWLSMGAHWVVLLKPQFELGPQRAPGGIVKDPRYHEQAIEDFRSCVQRVGQLSWVGLTESPILGQDGNKEFLICLKKI